MGTETNPSQNEVATESDPTEEQVAPDSPKPHIPTLSEIRNTLLNASEAVSGDATAASGMLSASVVRRQAVNNGMIFASSSDSQSLKAQSSSSIVNEALKFPARETISTEMVPEKDDALDASGSTADTKSNITSR